MINKIKRSVEQKKESFRNKIKEMGKEGSRENKKQKVVSTGRTLRSHQVAGNFQASPRQNKLSASDLHSSKRQQDDFKNRLLAHLKKTKLKQQQQNKTFVPYNSYIPKLKHKRSKQHSRRSLPSVSLDQNDNLQLKKQRKVSEVFIGSPDITQVTQEQKFSKVNHMSILLAGGRKKKIDTVMYMKKLKTKNEFGSTVITQCYLGNSNKTDDCIQIRPLFLRKDLASYKRSSSLNRKSQRKLSPQTKARNHAKQHFNCRPWSATLSEYQK